jgi:5'-nucleotidase
MNYLAPDVVALGNHEFDYGLPHLLFLEKMANFPIVNANLYISTYNKRLMQPYIILNQAGFDVLFTGVITEKVMDSIKQDELISSFVTLEEASREVGRILNAYKNDDIDLTILLTHIGFESDVQLANLLKSEWGVDIIIGGHSHTIMEQPAQENNILIAQAGVGTDQIGRFDIVVDDDTNSIIEYKWQLIPIDDNLAEPDVKLQSMIIWLNRMLNFKSILAHFRRQSTASIIPSYVSLLKNSPIRNEKLKPRWGILSQTPLLRLQSVMSCWLEAAPFAQKRWGH